MHSRAKTTYASHTYSSHNKLRRADRLALQPVFSQSAT